MRGGAGGALFYPEANYIAHETKSDYFFDMRNLQFSSSFIQISCWKPQSWNIQFLHLSGQDDFSIWRQKLYSKNITLLPVNISFVCVILKFPTSSCDVELISCDSEVSGKHTDKIMQHPKFCEYQNIFLLIYLTETNVQYQIKK
jgi:hypothetical protein